MINQSLSRREALRRMLVGAGAAAATPVWVRMLSETALAARHSHSQEATPAAEGAWKPRTLDPHQLETVEVISEMIIPETETGGAKAAGVPQFIDNVLAESDEHPRNEFLKGLSWVDSRSNQLFGADFVAAAPAQMTALLTILSSPGNRSLEDRPGVDFFTAIKSLTVTGYYTSEVGIYDELEDGELFFNNYDGCTHPEHKG